MEFSRSCGTAGVVNFAQFILFRKINIPISIWQTGIKQVPVYINLMNMRRHSKHSELNEPREKKFAKRRDSHVFLFYVTDGR
jgi:hypothetical protein